MGVERVEFLASLPFPNTAMRVLGDGGYVVYLNVPEDELGNVMQLMLMRQSVIKVTVENLGTQPIKKGKKKPAKESTPEWGDDGDTDTSDYTG